MPDLPEVETVRRTLKSQLAGRAVKTVEVCSGRSCFRRSHKGR